MEIINISDIENQELGGKAIGIKKLIDKGLPVPKAFAIDQDFTTALLNNEEEAIKKFKKFISFFDDKTKFAIRSSASNEDGNDNSFAGMYESVLNVEYDFNKIIEAIKSVNLSASSKRKTSYNSQVSKMNIIIQKMIDPKIAGVCFTKAIDLNGEETTFIEYVEGLGESLVSGKKTAKIIKVDLHDLTYQSEENISRELIGDLLRYLKILTEQTEEALDIEWCIDKENNAFFVQARPITRRILIRPKTINGAIASPGLCAGEIYIIDEEEDNSKLEQRIEKFPQGAVLLAKTTDTNYVPAMKKASGIITTEGSILSHAAIIAREFNKPCITGFKNAFSIFKEGKKIKIDTAARKIVYDGIDIPFGDGKEVNELELYIFDNVSEEKVNNNIILVELLEGEFGIHISDELEQTEIDEIEIYIRKKYKKAPIILRDQKYLWYFELKRFMNIPGFSNLLLEAKEIVEKLNFEDIDTFIAKIFNIMNSVNQNVKDNYEKLFASELGQALHFIINLYMCNGIAMKKIIVTSSNIGLKTFNEIFNCENCDLKLFFKKIESIRESIWEQFVKNGWTTDDYFDYRDDDMKRILNYNEEDVVDYFYKNLNISADIIDILIKGEGIKKKYKISPSYSLIFKKNNLLLCVDENNKIIKYDVAEDEIEAVINILSEKSFIYIIKYLKSCFREK